jgi:V/A-type H+-transporting ATPase subunit E
MPLESILNHILSEAAAHRNKIIEEAKSKRRTIVQEARLETGRLYQERINEEKGICEAKKQRLVVAARLEQKKNLLKTRQELIDSAFQKLKSTLARDKFKKQQVLADKVREAPEDIDFYLEKTRQDYETEIARILFS